MQVQVMLSESDKNNVLSKSDENIGVQQKQGFKKWL